MTEKNFLRELGFGKEIEMMEDNICPFCRKPVDQTLIVTEDQKAEFEVTRMCPACFERIGKRFHEFVNTVLAVGGEEAIEDLVDVMIENRRRKLNDENNERNI